MKTQEVGNSFIADCKLRRLSPETIKGYIRHIKYLVQVSPEFPPQSIIIKRSLADIKGTYNPDFHYRTWHALGNYAEKEFGIPNFMKNITRPKIPKEIMPTISSTELNLLAAFLEKAPIRDKAIMALFIDTAIRKGEAVNLKRKDILEDRIIIHGKTGYRVAPISGVTRDLLLSLPIYDDGFVFHNMRKRKPLKGLGFYRIVRKYLRSVGYQGKQFGPQVLRRSFGVFHLKDGGDLKSLSLILGHSNITTTAKFYAPLLAEDIIEIHRKHTPGRVFAQIVEEGGEGNGT